MQYLDSGGTVELKIGAGVTMARQVAMVVD